MTSFRQQASDNASAPEGLSPVPLVSVIVPVYKTERYLAECLKSILGQTLSDLEVVVIDDCSPDRSEDIIMAAAAGDRRVRYIKHDVNLGLGGARNTGMRASRGRYLASVDSDDFIAPTTLYSAVRRCEDDGTPVSVFSGYDYYEGSGVMVERPLYALEEFPAIYQVAPDDLNRLFPTFQLKVFRREWLLESGVEFPEKLYHEDEEFHLKLFALTLPKVSVIPDRLYVHRKRKDASSIMDNTRKTRKDMPLVLLNAVAFLRDRGVLDVARPAIERKIERALGYLHFIFPEYRADYYAAMQELLKTFGPMSTVSGEAVASRLDHLRTHTFLDYLMRECELADATATQRDTLMKELAQLRRELGDMRDSSSWKLTAPLRGAVDWIRRARRMRQLS